MGGGAGFARWLGAMAKTAGRDFNGVQEAWQIYVRAGDVYLLQLRAVHHPPNFIDPKRDTGTTTGFHNRPAASVLGTSRLS